METLCKICGGSHPTGYCEETKKQDKETSSELNMDNIRNNIGEYLVSRCVLTKQEMADLTPDRIDELVIRTAHDLANLPDALPENSAKKVRRILGLTAEQGGQRPSTEERNEQISQVVNEMRKYLEEFKKDHPYITGFVLCGSRMDKNKVPVTTSDVDVVLILKSGYTCNPKTPEGEKLLTDLRNFSDNHTTESGFPVELDEIYSTDEFIGHLKDEDKVKIIWGWNPEATQYIGEPLNGLEEKQADEHIKDSMNSPEIRKLKDEALLEAYKKATSGKTFAFK